MAASVRIEDEAFSDLRYEILASHCGLADADHARGKMARLWRQCTQEQTHILSESEITQVLGIAGVDGILASRLGSRVKNGVRIRGTKGRIEWLANLRRNGSKGGRPIGSKTRQKPSGFRAENPPAPAPAPAQKTKTKDIAASPLVGENQDDPKPTKPRPRCLLWDALVSITGADASIKSVASHIGRVRKALAEANPPYTPDEVLSLPAVAAIHLPWASGRVLTLGEIEKNISLVRSRPTPVGSSTKTKTDQNRAAFAEFLKDEQ